jgi:hypothetical protein
VCAIQFRDARRNLAAGPGADGLLEQAMLVGELEVNHVGTRLGAAYQPP